jgi:hypothetical protein
VHLRGYHLKASRLFELLHKPSAAFMAADSRTILMDPRFRNIFDLGQCGTAEQPQPRRDSRQHILELEL